jgi:predicted MFS family arabinose efflux permease
MTATGALFGGFFSALYIAFVLRGLHLPPALLGLGIAAGGAGSFAGAALAQPMARWWGVGPAICLNGVFSALGTMLLLLAPAQPIPAMVALVVSQILGDTFGTVPLILSNSLRQSVLPGNLLGRVGAAFRAIAGAGAAVGALTGGALAEGVGMRATLLLAIAGLMIGPVYGLLSPLRKVREMPT